jgi:putative isomerase
MRIGLARGLVFIFLLMGWPGGAWGQAGDPAARYGGLIRKDIYRDYPGMLRAPDGALKYPFVVPGSVYSSQLWDWDSWLCTVALAQILHDQKGEAGKAETLSYGEGCVLDFLLFGTEDGHIPILIRAGTDPAHYRAPNANTTNMHKPVLAQDAAFLTKLNGDDAEWLRAGFPKLEAFIRNYDEHRKNGPTGLYFWNDDAGVGVDNDPSSFFRPPNSCGSIYLNCLMYKELKAMAYLASCLKLPGEVSAKYDGKAEALQAAIRKNCWDERDGFYYSVDLDLRPVTHTPTGQMGDHFVLHAGHPRDYDCLIQRLEGWSGLMTMWAGIATPEQARRMVEEHLKNEKTLGGAYGVRSLSKMEKMYGIYYSGNPSDWDGPVWGISNYMVFRGLLKYGFMDEAKEMANKTITLFGQDYERNNTLNEYYDPDTGKPVGNTNFQDWNYLVLNMVDWAQGQPVMSEF